MNQVIPGSAWRGYGLLAMTIEQHTTMHYCYAKDELANLYRDKQARKVKAINYIIFEFLYFDTPRTLLFAA